MSSVAVIERYEEALEVTRSMLDAAHKADWELLVELEKRRATIVDQIKNFDLDPARHHAPRERKRDLIRAIMQCDEQIQMLTQDWMRELREILGTINAQQRLSRTYGV